MVIKVLERPTLVLNRNWQPVHVATPGPAADTALERVGHTGANPVFGSTW